MWERGIRWGLNHPQMFWFFRQFEASPYVTEIFRREGSVRFEFIQSFLERGIDEGFLRNAPINLLYRLVISATSGVVEELLLTDADPEDYIPSSFDVMWTGLQHPR